MKKSKFALLLTSLALAGMIASCSTLNGNDDLAKDPTNPDIQHNDNGDDEPGGEEPGGEEPGGDQPGGEEPGGDEPGGDEPGEETGVAVTVKMGDATLTLGNVPDTWEAPHEDLDYQKYIHLDSVEAGKTIEIYLDGVKVVKDYGPETGDTNNIDKLNDVMTVHNNASDVDLIVKVWKSGWVEIYLGGREATTYEHTYYIASNVNGWKANEAFGLTLMEEKKEDKDQYKSDVLSFKAGDQFKIYSPVVLDENNNPTWYGAQGNYSVPSDGEYVVYFVPDGGIADWIDNGGFFYVAKQEGTDPVGPNPGEGEETATEYYVTGSMNEYGIDEAYKLTLMTEKKDGKDQYESSVLTFAAETMIKVRDNKDHWYPDGTGNDYTITVAGDYKIYFVPEGGIAEWSNVFFYVAKQEGTDPVDPNPGEGEETATEYYVTGSMNEYGIDEAYKLTLMTEKKDGKDQYESSVLTFAANTMIKVRDNKDHWYPDGTGNDYTIEVAGDYKIYFVPEGGIAEWSNGYFYVAKQEGTDPVDPNPGEGEETQKKFADFKLVYGAEEATTWNYENGVVGTAAASDDENVKEQLHFEVTLAAYEGFKIWDGSEHFANSYGALYLESSVSTTDLQHESEADKTAKVDNNIICLVAGTYDVYFKHYENGGYSIWASKKAGENQDPVDPNPGEGEETATEYYVTGSMNEYGIDEAYKLTLMTEKKDGKDQYESSVLTFAANTMIKVRDNKDHWYPDGTGNDYTITVAGDYKIYFVPEGGIADWTDNGYFYVAKQEATDPVDPNPGEGQEDDTELLETYFEETKEVAFGKGIFVVGDFNNWTASVAYRLAWSEGNVWSGVISIPKGTHEYKFVEANWDDGSDMNWYNTGANLTIEAGYTKPAN